MKKAWAWLRRHPFLVFLALALGAGAALWLYVQSPTRLDMEHFNQIRLGMTADDVEDILGAPPGKFGIPDGWFADAWLRWKARASNLQMQSFQVGDCGYILGGNRNDVRNWQLLSVDRFASIAIFLDDNGKVRGASLAQCEF